MFYFGRRQEHFYEDVRPFAKRGNFGHIGPEDGIHSFIYSADIMEYPLWATSNLALGHKDKSWFLQSIGENSTINRLYNSLPRQRFAQVLCKHKADAHLGYRGPGRVANQELERTFQAEGAARAYNYKAT